MTTLNLFCLPFAGGNKYSYRGYSDKTPSFLKIIPLEYPGRGGRVKEPLITDINVLVDDLYNKINNIVDQKDYAVYGHSMGGLVAWLLTRKLIENNHRAPLHVFITGTTGPSDTSRSARKRHLLGKKEFVKEMKEFNGIPDEILENEELLNYFEPILRADFKACESYMYENCAPLNMPLTVITGTEEDMELEDIHLWQKETKCVADFRRMPGKHFFIFKYPFEIVEVIYKKLSVHTRGDSQVGALYQEGTDRSVRA